MKLNKNKNINKMIVYLFMLVAIIIAITLFAPNIIDAVFGNAQWRCTLPWDMTKKKVDEECETDCECSDNGVPGSLKCCKGKCVPSRKDWFGIAQCPSDCYNAPLPLGEKGFAPNGNCCECGDEACTNENMICDESKFQYIYPREQGKPCDTDFVCDGYSEDNSVDKNEADDAFDPANVALTATVKGLLEKFDSIITQKDAISCCKGLCGKATEKDALGFYWCPGDAPDYTIKTTDLPVGAKCGINSVCNSGLCIGGFCVAEKLVDGKTCSEDLHCQNNLCIGFECVASKLADGKMCSTDHHCASGQCSVGFCVAKKLENGEKCVANSACKSGICIGGECVAEKLADGKTCSENEHCQNNLCIGLKCVASKIENNYPCSENDHCKSGLCNGVCQASGKLVNGKTCSANSACSSGMCIRGICSASKLNTKAACLSKTDCKSNNCLTGYGCACSSTSPCSKGQTCRSHKCQKIVCTKGFLGLGPEVCDWKVV